MIEVQRAEPVISPAYDIGQLSEADIRAIHRAPFDRLHEAATAPSR